MSEYSVRRRVFWLIGVIGAALTLSLLGQAHPQTPFFTVLVAGSPFYLGIALLAFFLWPTPNRTLGTTTRDKAPAPLRPGNPILRQPGPGCSLTLAFLGMWFAGCTGIGMDSIGHHDDPIEGALFAVFISASLLCWAWWSWVRWIEVDVETLRLHEHHLLFGLKVSQPPRSAIEYLAVCWKDGNYSTFGFTGKGLYLCLGQISGEHKVVLADAQKLADQLMVPLIQTSPNLHPDRLFSQMRSGQAPTLQNDWLPTTMSATLESERSPLPPID